MLLHVKAVLIKDFCTILAHEGYIDNAYEFKYRVIEKLG